MQSGAPFCQDIQDSGLTTDQGDLWIGSGLWDEEVDTRSYINRPLELNGLIVDTEPARDTFNMQHSQGPPPAPNTGAIGSFNESINPQSTANFGLDELPRGDHNVGRAAQLSTNQLLSPGQQTATHSLHMQTEESVVQDLRLEIAMLRNEVETKKRKIQALESRNDELGRQNESLKVDRLMSEAESSESRHDQLGRQHESFKVSRSRVMSAVGISEFGNATAPTTPVPRQRRYKTRVAPGMPRRNTPRSPPDSSASRQSSYRGPSSSQGSQASWQNNSSPAPHTSAMGGQSGMVTSPFNNHAMSSHSDTPFSLFTEAVRSRRDSTSSSASRSDDDLAQASLCRRVGDERLPSIGAVHEWRNGSLPRRLLHRESSADGEEDLTRFLTRLNLRQDEL
ncbi:hypothetical protein PV04_02384 [Phialophora macrospora]|uniref:Uncharacterized protein n=1 Tax=Phialophora macrospora TaxID=1851006 RepID=A0A0D2CY20_9EURO|nr:hypothetical protein PV04_02384 [Phialophora macrospora]